MTGEQLASLKRSLDAAEIRALMGRQTLRTSTESDRLEQVDLQIYQDGRVQHAGYVIWHGDSPQSQMDALYPQQAREERASKAALDPIVLVIDGLKGKSIAQGETSQRDCQ